MQEQPVTNVLPETDTHDGETGPREPSGDPSTLSELSREHTQTIRSEGHLPNDEPDPAGDTISSYRIERLLGKGGMGFVYEAQQRSPRRAVALKVMRHGHRVDEVHARLFQREAETLARLRHSNIAAIYESGHTEDGRDFFAMELVEGQTLDAWLNEGHAASTRARLRLFQAICKPVHYAHQRRALGDTHRDTMSTMNSLAVVHTDQGRYAAAEALHSTLLELRSRVLGPNDTDTLKSMTNLAVVCYYQQRLDDAASLFSAVLDIQRRQLGPTHPSTLATANNLAVIYQQQERYTAAEKLHAWTLQEKRRVLGDDHAETLSSLYNLAIVYTAQNRFDAADAAHQQVYEGRRRTLGPTHPQTLKALSALAGLAALQGDATLALQRLEAAVEGGYTDADTLTTDADFDSLRQDPRFVTLIERARSNGGR
jgi:tetratricopeptide (TPR) repeat protein